MLRFGDEHMQRMYKSSRNVIRNEEVNKKNNFLEKDYSDLL